MLSVNRASYQHTIEYYISTAMNASFTALVWGLTSPFIDKRMFTEYSLY